jgi:hypothetical protein
MLKAKRSGIITEKDGKRHRVTAGQTLWSREMLGRMRLAFLDFWDVIDASKEYREASRRLRRSRHRSPTGSRPRTWKLP